MLNNRTQRFIALELIDMCSTHRLADVTISQLCKHAGISRSTFYNHFDGMDDLTMFAACLPDLTADPDSSFADLIRARIDFDLQHRDFFEQLPDLNQFNSYWLGKYAFMSGKGLRYCPSVKCDAENPSKALTADMCVASVFLVWWAGGLKTPADQVTSQILAVERAFRDEPAHTS